MKITAADLCGRGLIERVIAESEPASAKSLPELAEELFRDMAEFFAKYGAMTGEEIREQRYRRFRDM